MINSPVSISNENQIQNQILSTRSSVEKKLELQKKLDKERMYKSTYSGVEEDSDQDRFHITMPFKHSQELHHKILNEPEFESDESFCWNDDEQDKINAGQLEK